MTLKFPDVSSFQAGLSLKDAPAVMARATEGDWLIDSAYQGFKAQATAMGVPFGAYSFLESASSSRAQAQFAFNAVGPRVPLMLDWEPIAASARTTKEGHTCGSGWRSVAAESDRAGVVYVSRPGVEKALNFIHDYRAIGGICSTLYLPHWYWQVLGSPDLGEFASLGMALVSSDYTDLASGAGWVPYGGLTPQVWQFTDTYPFNGMRVDENAFKGDAAMLEALWENGTHPAHAVNPVTGLRVTHRGWTSVTLTWDPALGATHYRVTCLASDGSVKDVKAVTATTARIGRLSIGHEYTFRVRAQPGGEGGKNAEVTVKTR